jgi:hypothetical protein
MNALSNKLTNRLDGIRTYSVGISVAEVQKVSVTSDLLVDIFECLESSNISDNQMALFFTEVLIPPGKLDSAQEGRLIFRIEKLSRGERQQIRASCYKFLRRFYLQVPNYRNLMLQGLSDSDPMVRMEALLGFETYCKRKDTIVLENFENDSYVSETSMNGPLVYQLRNLALETIERVIRKAFEKVERTEVISNRDIAFWWDWAPYHKWKSNWLRRLIG